MSTAICIASGKGGTGKTSLSAGLSCCLAALGNTVLAIDLDLGLRNLDLVLGMTEQAVFDFTDVLEGRVTLNAAVTAHPQIPGLHFLGAPLGLPREPVSVSALGALVAQAKEQYDYCVLDCPAGIGEGFRQAAHAVDRAIVVCTPDQTSLRDAQMTHFALRDAGVTDIRLVLNRARSKISALPLDEIIDRTGLRLLGVVPEDRAVIAHANRGTLLFSDLSAPAAKAYRNITHRLLGENRPLLRRCRRIR